MSTPFPVSPELTAIAIGYRNKKLIADVAMPRVQVSKSEFKWMERNEADGFTLPSSLVGRTGTPTVVEFNGQEKTNSTRDYALVDVVPLSDIENAPKGYDPEGIAVEGLTDLILLGREVRVAKSVFDASNYATTKALSGAAQWNDGTSDPLKEIMTALDTPIMRPNLMVIGRAAYTQLSTHPKVVKAVSKTGADSGVAARMAIAELLELDEIAVGEAYLNTAKAGATATLERVWGKHCALIYRDPALRSPNGAKLTWGFTAQFGTWEASSSLDANIGLRGAKRIRVGESVMECVASKKLGYLLTSVAA